MNKYNALYVRVSTAEQMKHGYSIQEQQDRLIDFCVHNGWKKYKVYNDAGVSGGNMKRPAIKELINDVENGMIERVIVYKLDRLSRSQKDTLRMIEDIFIPNKVDFVSMSEDFKIDTVFGAAMIGMVSVFAQLERGQIRERMTMGRLARAKSGLWDASGNRPVGYDYIDGKLVINEYEAMQVREIYKKYIMGYRVTDIQEYLTEKGYTTIHGPWKISRICCVLRNKLYTGKVSYAGEWYDGIHEPIIDENTYNQAAAIIEKKPKKKQQKVHDAYFVGKLYCARCGARYGCKRSTYKDKTYRYYWCYSKINGDKSTVKDPNCDNVSYYVEDFEKAIFDELRKIDAGYVHECRDTSNDPQKETMLRKEIAKVEKQIAKLIDLYTLDKLSMDDVNDKAEALNAKKDALEKELAEISTKHIRTDAEIDESIKTIDYILDHGKPEHIRRLIDTWIDKIEIDGDDITIYWDFE